MGQRGAAPKPTNLKILQGTYRKGRAPHHEATPPDGIPPCPEQLSDVARAEWDYIVPILLQHRLLTTVDGAILAAYCQARADWLEALEKVKAGRVQTTDTGYEAMRAWQTIYERAEKRMTTLAREFGLSASSRTRISVPDKPRHEEDPFKKVAN